MKITVPEEFDRVRELTRRAIAPLRPVDEHTKARQDFLLLANRAVGSEALPQPHIIYFLLAELLGFTDLGRFEKLAWSIPVDFNGKAFLIEHRKFGVGVCTQDVTDLDDAKKIAVLLRKAARCARPYFEWKAREAVKASEFNVANHAGALLGRYQYLRGLFESARDEADRSKEEVIVTERRSATTYTRPFYRLDTEARWLAISAIEAFFSWTEHVFIHIAILKSAVTTGEAFATLSGAEWNVKFKRALDIVDPVMKAHFDDLIEIRRRVRNFIAHGAFGKDGETLHFHSNTGAVPVQLDVTKRKGKFSIGEGLVFNPEDAFKVIDAFVDYLSGQAEKPAWLYVQEYALPLIMTMARDGTYQRAMESLEDMKQFANRLAGEMDNAMNMDW